MNRHATWCATMGRVAEVLADGRPRTGAELLPLFGAANDHLRRSMLGRFVRLGWLERLPAASGAQSWHRRYRLGDNDSWRRSDVARLDNHREPCNLTHRAIATVAYSLQLQKRQRRLPRADRRQAVRIADGALELAVALFARAFDADPELRAAVVPAGGRR